MCGVTNAAIQKRLLAEDGLDPTRALEIAQGIEAADKNSRELKAEPTATAGLNFAGSSEKRQSRSSCYRCGRNHDAQVCQFKEAVCRKCKKTGHIAPVCKAGSQLAS